MPHTQCAYPPCINTFNVPDNAVGRAYCRMGHARKHIRDKEKRTGKKGELEPRVYGRLAWWLASGSPPTN